MSPVSLLLSSTLSSHPVTCSIWSGWGDSASSISSWRTRMTVFSNPYGWFSLADSLPHPSVCPPLPHYLKVVLEISLSHHVHMLIHSPAPSLNISSFFLERQTETRSYMLFSLVLAPPGPLHTVLPGVNCRTSVIK